MLEAVTTSLQGSSTLLAKAKQTDTSNSFAANPTQAQQVTQAPYISPYIAVVGGNVVEENINPTTGQIVGQIPSQNQIQAQQYDPVKEAQSQQASTSATPQTTSDSAPTPGAQTPPAPSNDQGATNATPVTNQQQTAFANASQAGNANAGNVTLFA